MEASPGAFDLTAHMAALVIYALEDEEHAPPVGWLRAFADGGKPEMPLSALMAAYRKLPNGVWKNGDTPLPLIEKLPVFGVSAPGGEILTEPVELMRVSWDAPDRNLVLFAGMAEKLPYLKARSAIYLSVLSEWYKRPAPERGLARLCRQYAALYNARLYTEAYKLLEMRWMIEEGDGKKLLQGLMQLAVGLHQIENGKYAVPQLEEGFHNIRQHAHAFPAPTLPRFLKRLEKVIGLLKGAGPENFQTFDLGLLPHLWMESPWKALFK